MRIGFTLRNDLGEENLGIINKETTIHCFVRQRNYFVELNEDLQDHIVSTDAQIWCLSNGHTMESVVNLERHDARHYKFRFDPQQPRAGSYLKFQLRIFLSKGRDSPSEEVTHKHPFCVWKTSVPPKYLLSTNASNGPSMSSSNIASRTGFAHPLVKTSDQTSNSSSTRTQKRISTAGQSEPGFDHPLVMTSDQSSNSSSMKTRKRISTVGQSMTQDNATLPPYFLDYSLRDIVQMLEKSSADSQPQAHLIPTLLPTKFDLKYYGTMGRRFPQREDKPIRIPRREKNPKIAAARLESNGWTFELIDLGQGAQSRLLDNALIRLLGDHADKLVLLRLNLPDTKVKNSNNLKNDLAKKLANGFTMKGDPKTQYVFLAASNSGAKSGTCYCIETELWNETIQRFGTFDEAMKSGIRKLQSRIGMIASTSLASINLERDDLVDIEDIKSENPVDGYVYELTDGAGVVTYSLAKRMTDSISLNEVPSAFQIRVAGYKGVVAVYPDDSAVIKSLRQEYRKPRGNLFLRSSMKKFESNNKSVSILNYSQRMRGNLSRQLLTVLHELSPLIDEKSRDRKSVV